MSNPYREKVALGAQTSNRLPSHRLGSSCQGDAKPEQSTSNADAEPCPATLR